MADAHGESSGGNPYTFLFLLAGAMVAAVVFKAIHTGIPLTTALMGTTTSTATVVSSAPAVSEVNPNPPTQTPRKKKVPVPQDHWTTVTLDQDGRVMSIVHY